MDSTQGTQEWRLTSAPNGATQLHFTFDYTVPASLGGVIADKLFIEGQNENQFRASLANLKSLAEYAHTRGGLPSAEMHADSAETALEILRKRLGSRWVGREGAGRVVMTRVLNEALGYDKHWANEVITALVHANRLRFHPAGEDRNTGEGRAPGMFGLGSASGGMPGSSLAISVGYWQIGLEDE